MRRAFAAAIALVTAGCVAAGDGAGQAGDVAVVQAVPVRAPAPAVPPVTAGPTTFLFSGELTQGGWIRGQAPAGTVAARLGAEALALDREGRFFAAFDRDAGPAVTLSATLDDGTSIASPLAIAPRDWAIERVNVARTGGRPSQAFLRIRRPELARIAAARALDTGSEGWRQDFIWPVTGRISGRFGSQRIYRGEPGSYHSGIDIATGESGTAYLAPADGVVVLAAEDEPFSLEGKLLMIDHGMGLNSAFLHSSALLVREGERVRQGQPIGRIGATGRASGPHLHWSLKWRDARLDPLLFTGPMD
ncbi:MAG: M23 family metallopeptidase [Porphyrobacter sp.]|nr:M23 family metallopeptidase [Porphyrobacter sp.]